VLEEYAHRKSGERECLVKWSNLDYSDATWEPEEEVARDGQGRVRGSIAGDDAAAAAAAAATAVGKQKQ
jgi:hypothetical protein